MTMPFGPEVQAQAMEAMNGVFGPDQLKVPISQVNYRESTTDQSCGNCANFYPEESMCGVVEGQVSAGGVCDRWEEGGDALEELMDQEE